MSRIGEQVRQTVESLIESIERPDTELRVIVEIARENDDPAGTGLSEEAGFLVTKCGPGQPGYESART